MIYSEERLQEIEKQFELAQKGFELVLKDLVYSEDKTNLYKKVEPYVTALKSLKVSLEYAKREVENDKAKDNV